MYNRDNTRDRIENKIGSISKETERITCSKQAGVLVAVRHLPPVSGFAELAVLS